MRRTKRAAPRTRDTTNKSRNDTQTAELSPSGHAAEDDKRMNDIVIMTPASPIPSRHSAPLSPTTGPTDRHDISDAMSFVRPTVPYQRIPSASPDLPAPLLVERRCPAGELLALSFFFLLDRPKNIKKWNGMQRQTQPHLINLPPRTSRNRFTLPVGSGGIDRSHAIAENFLP